MDEPDARIGTLIAVVGPSGAGKDSVMGVAVRHFSGCEDVHFVRRAITRADEAGGEDHESLCAADFQDRQAKGDFAVSWQAHGLQYGIPAEAAARARQGQIVIANGSRAALSQFQSAFPRLVVANIVAARDVLAARLLSRGRESEADIRQRLDRRMPDHFAGLDVVTIDNSGPLEIAANRFVDLIAACRSSVSATPYSMSKDTPCASGNARE